MTERKVQGQANAPLTDSTGGFNPQYMQVVTVDWLQVNVLLKGPENMADTSLCTQCNKQKYKEKKYTEKQVTNIT